MISRSPRRRRTAAARLEPDFETFDSLLCGSKAFGDHKDIAHDSVEIYEHLIAFYGSQLGGFDCFDVGGWRPTENELSDVIAALLAPEKPHGLGLGTLKSLLERLLDHSALSPVQRDRVRNVSNVMKVHDESITVKRERIGSMSRADIEIWGRNFLIIIEHKVAKGRETFRDDQYQTFRLVNDFKTKAAKFGIDPTHVLFIFLAPEGMRPHHEEFIPLSFEFMSHVLLRAVAQRQNTPAHRSILGFSEFYRRLG